MKALSFSRLCLVGALTVGLFVAWTSIAPQTALKDVTGGGCYCKNVIDITCDDANPHCHNLIEDCNMEGTSPNTLDCDTPPDAGQCAGDLKEWEAECNAYEDQTCNDD